MATKLKHKIFTFFNTINQLGIIEGKHSAKEKKKIILFNIICLLWYASTTIQICNHLFRTPINFAKIKVHLIIMSIVVLSQILHAKQYFNLGKILYLCCLTLVSLIFSSYISPGQLTEFYLLFVPSVGLILFDNKYITFSVLIFTILFFTIPTYYFKNYPASIVFHTPVLICLFLGNYLLTNYFKNLNEKNEKLLALERDKVLSDKIILEKQEAKLRELNQFKTHFFVNLSHEIRTPITLIKGYASKINFEESKQENEHKMSIVNQQIHQIESILNSILDLSKLDENKLTLQTTEVPILSFINKHYAEFKTLFDKKKIDFNIEVATENLGVIMDSGLLSKAINNLLNNALKFTKEYGKVSITVFKNDGISIQITDNGIGIPEEDIIRVFDRFYQSKNEITKSQGSGIGLSFTKSILEAHDFDISLISKPNIETTFTITIPKKYCTTTKELSEATLPILEHHNDEVTALNIVEPSNAATILIVDDHSELRHYLRTVLKSYKILEAANGKEALALIKSKRIDMVVTDYMMPEMDGKQLVTEIKKLQIKIPILMLTARVDDFAKLDMLRIGVDTYMIKPFIEEELVLSVKNALRTYENILVNQQKLTNEEKEELDKVETNFHKNIRKVIEDNLSNFNFGVEDIALFFTISKRTLNRRVKSILGRTTQELIIQARVEKARELQLRNPEMSKKAIANNVGISNTSYLFKKLVETYGKHYAS